MGAFTIEKPMPNTAKTINSSHTGVVADKKVSITDAAVISTPATTSDGRPPNRPTRRPESGEKIRRANRDRKIDQAGVHRRKPRSPCRYSDIMNRKAPQAENAEMAITVAEANGILRKKRRSMNGSWRRYS